MNDIKIEDILSTEDKKIATRQAYGQKLAAMGEENKDIVVLDCDLSKSTMTSIFAEKFPERFFNFGIAEANMTSAAAGLATMGKIPFASTFAVFATKRACDQLSSSVAYTQLNVKICATHSGISVGEDGATHQSVEDLAITRSIPGIVVLSPADATETEKMMEAIVAYNGPCYVRLCRSNVPVLFNDNYRFAFGKGIRLMQGKDVSIISTGFATHIAYAAAKRLSEDGVSVDFVNMGSIKPVDEDLIVDTAKKTSLVLTVEDHSIIGGLGSAVCETLAARQPTKVIRLGVQDKFGSSGSPMELVKAYGFDEDSIIATVKEAVK
jgi:transketolase